MSGQSSTTETTPASMLAGMPARSNLLQRKCACGGTPGPTGECAECRKKRLQRRAVSQAAPVPPVVEEVLRSPGQPLDTATRAFMEGRFGQVRVHSDELAAESARAVSAHAHTVGRDPVFGAGRYAPATPDEKRLLAHIVQQCCAPAGAAERAPILGSALDQTNLGRAEKRAIKEAVRGVLQTPPPR